jgi:serine/threonine protein kinase
VHVSLQVLTGLQHLHRLGVLHRDLRTSNILVEGRDPLHVLVADFGVSHVLRQLEGAAGTVGYEGLRLLSAGEAVHGLGALGKWSCILGLGPWALGLGLLALAPLMQQLGVSCP